MDFKEISALSTDDGGWADMMKLRDEALANPTYGTVRAYGKAVERERRIAQANGFYATMQSLDNKRRECGWMLRRLDASKENAAPPAG